MSDEHPDNDSANLFEGFSFTPDWAKESAESNSANLHKYAARFEREDRDDDRRDGRPGRRFDRRDGDRKPFRRDGDKPFRRDGDKPFRRDGDKPFRRDGDKPFRRDGDRPRFERAPREPAPYSVRFLPEQDALTLIAKKVFAARRAMPLRDLVALFFKTPDSTLVRVEYDEAHKDRHFHQCTACQWFSQDEESLKAHLIAEHFAEAFEPREVTVEAPTGKFSCVAKCGVTGKLLAPPNHHLYNRRIQEMLHGECAGMSEAEYRSRIELVNDPEAIEQWRQECTHQQMFVRKADSSAKPAPAPAEAAPAPEPAPEAPAAEAAEPAAEAAAPAEQLYSREEAEEIFLREVAPKMVRHGRQVTCSHAASKKIADQGILREISFAWGREQRSPVSSLFFAVRGGLRARKLALFRASDPRRTEFAAPRPPVALNAATAVPELKAVLDFVTVHTDCTRAELLAAVAPEGTDPAPYLKQLEFLVDRGNLIEYANGLLALPEEHPYYTEKIAKPAAKAEAPAAEEAPAPEAKPEEAVAAPAPDATEPVNAQPEAAPAAPEAPKQEEESATPAVAEEFTKPVPETPAP